MQKHAYIRQRFRNWWNDFSKLQLNILVVYYSLTRAQQIMCTVYCKYANLILCIQKISKAYALIYIFSHCILLFVNWLPLISFTFFTTLHNICFVLGNVFHDRDRKFPYANLHHNVWQLFHLKVDAGLCQHLRCNSLSQFWMLGVIPNNLHL